MFYIVRIAIACIAVLLTLLFTKRTKNRRRIVAIVIVMVAVLYQFSVVFPIEQIHKYDNAEEVFHYMYSGNIDFIEYGQDSAFVSFRRQSSPGSFRSAVILKKDGKYIVGFPKKIECIYSYSDSGADVDFYHLKNTNDYYLTIFGAVDTDSVSDSENHKFNFANGKMSSTTMVYIKDISNYSLTYTSFEHKYTISTYMENDELRFNVTGDINNSSEYLKGNTGDGSVC